MKPTKKAPRGRKNAVASPYLELPAELPRARRDLVFSIIPLALFLAQAVYFLAASPYAVSDFPLDDAWIHQVYARSFAFGGGFAYNPGEQEAGATSPLWVIAAAPAHWLEGFGTPAVVLAVKGIGVLLGLIGLFYAQRLASHLSGSKTIGMLTAAVFLLEPRFVFSALSGMEATLLFALITCGIYAMLTQRWTLASVCFGLAPVTRPEALFFLPFYGLYLFFMRRRYRAVSRPLVRIIPLVPMALWSVFCLFVNGHLLPNTFHLKAKPFHLDAQQVKAAAAIIAQHGLASTFLVYIGLAGFLAWMSRRHRGLRLWSGIFLIAIPLAYAFAVMGSREMDPGGYYWTRWIDPASLILSLAAAIGLALILSAALERPLFIGMIRRLKKRPNAVYAVSAAGLLCLAIAMPNLLRSMADRRFHLWSDSRAIHIINVAPGEWIDRTLPQNATVGVNDAGAIRYFGKRYTIDLKGLNYAAFAFGKVTHAQVIRRSDWIAVFPDWFRGSELLDYFEERKSFSIPLQEYTVCDCPGSTLMVVMEKKKEFSLTSPSLERYTFK
jgi:hypothetical protein